ncbi:hypothetical protein QFC19_009113 [Naganishia cerealis]|uniref:Uncharacterized protein n=1 Tax=Naganishia cerealis TaxID=610337 RepID=A0ACC2UWF5_9TREE|nr:hypothetical protein QFC19_009113 [Naganishia cerealis]
MPAFRHRRDFSSPKPTSRLRGLQERVELKGMLPKKQNKGIRGAVKEHGVQEAVEAGTKLSVLERKINYSLQMKKTEIVHKVTERLVALLEGFSEKDRRVALEHNFASEIVATIRVLATANIEMRDTLFDRLGASGITIERGDVLSAVNARGHHLLEATWALEGLGINTSGPHDAEARQFPEEEHEHKQGKESVHREEQAQDAENQPQSGLNEELLTYDSDFGPDDD